MVPCLRANNDISTRLFHKMLAHSHVVPSRNIGGVQFSTPFLRHSKQKVQSAQPQEGTNQTVAKMKVKESTSS
ncbi:hypothetical protein FOVSG1_000364 [Fusarium oxysporum f. sp. vasinfectum]